MFQRQGAVALWSSASTLDRKIEGSNLAANFSFERTTMTREKRGDEFGNENRKTRHARKTNDRRRVERARLKQTRSQDFKCERKGLDSKDVM